MNSARVVIFSGTHGEGFGAERVLEYLMSTTPLEISAIITPEGSGVGACALSKGISVFEWPSRSNSMQANLQAFLKFNTRNRNWNLIHAWHTRGFEWALAIGRFWNLPVTGTLHDDPTSSRNSWMRRFCIRKAAHHLKGLAVVSDALASICAEQAWKVPITRIRNGLPDTVNERSTTLTGCTRIGFLGLNERWKGIEIVAQLVPRFCESPVQWNLYGTPSFETEPILRKLLQDYPDHVRHHGRRPPEEIYSAADLIIHPSMNFDPYPTVLLEAARAGIATLASDIGGTSEIVQHEKTGLLYEPENVNAGALALDRLLSQPDLILQFGRNARQRFESKFTVDKMLEGYSSFWKAVINQVSPNG